MRPAQGLMVALLLPLIPPMADAAQSEARWWKGNLHTHSLWSDGDDYPEMIIDWYRRRGYHFLALSDHNVLQQGERWINATNNAGGAAAFEKYVKRFGDDWVDTRTIRNTLVVRLKTLEEYRGMFEAAGRFLLIPAEEITDRFKSAPVHLNATNLRDFIPPQGGESVFEVMQNNVNAVLQQRRRTGQPMFPHLNHPNFGWAVTAEDLMRVQGERFFEVYNGHPSVRNDGDALHASADRMWDIILTWRLAVLDLEPIFGLAVDDAHNYHDEGLKESNPGRGWIMVRSDRLTAEGMVEAIEAGEFYASSGVSLREVERGPADYALQIEPVDGVTFMTRFIGTRRGFDRSRKPRLDAQGQALAVTQRYSEEVGVVLAEVEGTTPRYVLKGDELYVRAVVTSSRVKSNPYSAGEHERAWTQPWVAPD